LRLPQQLGGRRRRAGVVPSAKDGLHCGWISRSNTLTGNGVVPSAKDGLHCGRYRITLPAVYPVASSRPPRTGSIAAGWDSAASPAGNQVVPSAKDGLHCGITDGEITG